MNCPNCGSITWHKVKNGMKCKNRSCRYEAI